MGIINFSANLLGTLINVIYGIVKNYGLALVIFTVLVKVVTFFMTLKQRQDSIKNARAQKRVKEIQEKYKGDTLTINQKTMEIYKEEKLSPLSSCLFFIVQIVLMLSMYAIVVNPLTYIKKTPKEKIDKYAQQITATEIKKDDKKVEEHSKEENTQKNETKETTETKLKEQNDSSKKEEEKKDKDERVSENIVSKDKKIKRMPRAIQIQIINHFGKEDKDVNFNMNFLGLDLTQMPIDSVSKLKEDFSFENLKVFILPFTYILFSVLHSYLSYKDTQKLTNLSKGDGSIDITDEVVKSKTKDDEKEKDKKAGEDDDSFAGTMNEMSKNMIFIGPFILFSLTMVSPLALALYWFVNAILSIIEIKLVDHIIQKNKIKDSLKLNSGVK